jgi:hypothetical protein
LQEARGLARLVAAGLLPERTVVEMLHGAGQARGKPDGEIEAIIAWAMANPSMARLPEAAGR